MTDARDADLPTPDEQRLLDALGDALPEDLPPAGLLGRAEQLLTFLDTDAELAALLAQPAETAGMRGGGAGDSLTFGTADGALAVEVAVERATVAGQVLAGVVVTVVLQSRAGVHAVTEPDSLGRFTFADVPRGPSRLTLRDATSREVVTDWFLI